MLKKNLPALALAASMLTVGPLHASTLLPADLIGVKYSAITTGTDVDGIKISPEPVGGAPALITNTKGIRFQTPNFSQQDGAIDQDANATLRIEAVRFDQNDKRYFGSVQTGYTLIYKNPSSVLPAFIPDFEVKLKNMYIEVDGGKNEKSPFTPISGELTQGADYETGVNRDSKATGVRLSYSVQRTDPTEIGNTSGSKTTVLHTETARLYGGYIPSITGGPDYKWETGSTMTGPITPLAIIPDVIIGSPEIGAKASIPDKTFTVSGGWLSPGASAEIRFTMALMARINSPEGTVFATFNDPLAPSFTSLGTTSVPIPTGDTTAPVPLPASGWLLLAAFGGVMAASRKRRGTLLT